MNAFRSREIAATNYELTQLMAFNPRVWGEAQPKPLPTDLSRTSPKVSDAKPVVFGDLEKRDMNSAHRANNPDN